MGVPSRSMQRVHKNVANLSKHPSVEELRPSTHACGSSRGREWWVELVAGAGDWLLRSRPTGSSRQPGHRGTVASRPLWEASQTEMVATIVASRPRRIGERGQSLAGSGEQAEHRLSITKHEERLLRGAPVLLRRAACCELGTPMGSRYREDDLFGPADRRERFCWRCGHPPPAAAAAGADGGRGPVTYDTILRSEGLISRSGI